MLTVQTRVQTHIGPQTKAHDPSTKAAAEHLAAIEERWLAVAELSEGELDHAAIS
jgi:hypothetical protein